MRIAANYHIFQIYYEFFDTLGKILHFLPSAAKPKLRDILHSKIRKKIISSAITLFISILAVYLAIFRPFGNHTSLWVSSSLFIGMLFWTLIDIIRFVIENFMLPIKIIQEQSLSYGIEEFIKWRWPNSIYAFDGYKLIRFFGPKRSSRCKNLPSVNSIIEDYIAYLAKDVILFASIFSAYILLVHWIFKPLILEKFAGLTTMQIYLFPITQISQELGW